MNNIWDQFENPNAADYYRYFFDAMVQLKPKLGLEVGFGWGMSAIAFLEARPYPALMYSVDLKEFDQSGWFNSVDKMIPYRDRWSMLAREEALTNLQDKVFDWLYIDANHELGFPEQDFEEFEQFLAIGGYLGFDDLGYPHIQQLVDNLLLGDRYTPVKIESEFKHPNDMAILRRIK